MFRNASMQCYQLTCTFLKRNKHWESRNCRFAEPPWAKKLVYFWVFSSWFFNFDRDYCIMLYILHLACKNVLKTSIKGRKICIDVSSCLSRFDQLALMFTFGPLKVGECWKRMKIGVWWIKSTFDTNGYWDNAKRRGLWGFWWYPYFSLQAQHQ